MSRHALIGCMLVVTAVGLAGWWPSDTRSAPAAPRSNGEDVLIDLGDVVRVKGGAVGCRVTRRAGFPGQKLLDCRRAGALPGTFGVLMGVRKLLVVRFEKQDVARVVFTATNAGESTVCRR
jgi:hypothetical protein